MLKPCSLYIVGPIADLNPSAHSRFVELNTLIAVVGVTAANNRQYELLLLPLPQVRACRVHLFNITFHRDIICDYRRFPTCITHTYTPKMTLLDRTLLLLMKASQILWALH